MSHLSDFSRAPAGLRRGLRHLLPVWVMLALLAGLPARPLHADGVTVSDVSFTTRGNEHLTLVDVTFTLNHPLGLSSWLHLWGHDAAIDTSESNSATGRVYHPMGRFPVDGKMRSIHTDRFEAGTHTLTWVASADGVTGEDIQSHRFQAFVRASDEGPIAPRRFMVIDVSDGLLATSFPVTYHGYLDVWEEEYKTDKIVLRELPDGSWAGVYQITGRQYELVTGEMPAPPQNYETRPVANVSWNDITGSGEYEWGFIAVLREKSGIPNLNLPSDTVWDYAARAGTTRYYTDYTEDSTRGSTSFDALRRVGWYNVNSGGVTHPVGLKRPNPWGLFDVHGNVAEWGTTTYGLNRRARGGGSTWDSTAARVDRYYSRAPNTRELALGFRLFRPSGSSAERTLHGHWSFESPTRISALKDYNGSGTPDALEDFNGSGFPDAFEELSGAGIIDAFQDFNGSGTPDAFEDFNGNGMPDAFEDYNRNGIPDIFEAGFADTTGSGLPDFFDTIRPSRIQSASHPDAREVYTESSFQVAWDPSDFPGMESGWLWMVDPSVETRVGVQNSLYLEPGTHSITVPDLKLGTYWFHLVPLDGNSDPIPHTQARFRFTVHLERPVITSPSHPDDTMGYFNPSLVAEWTSPGAAGSISGWLWRADQNRETLVGYSNGTLIGPGTTSVTVPDRGFGEHWFHLVPVDATGAVVHNLKTSFRYNVDIHEPVLSSSTHPDGEQGYFSGDFAVSWTTENTPDLVSGWRWRVDRDPETALTESNSQFASFGTTSLSIRNKPFGEHWFHIAPMDAQSKLIVERQVSYRFVVDIERPNFSSPTHPDPAYWYNSQDALIEWSSENASTSVSGWRVRISEGTPFTGNLTADNSQYQGAETMTLDLAGRAHGTSWLTVAPVDKAGDIINQRRNSFRFNVNARPLHVGSPSHPNQNVANSTTNVLLYWGAPDVSEGSMPFYYYIWGRNPSETPGGNDEVSSTTTKMFLAQPTGSHYFHVVGVDRMGNPTPPASFRVSIDEITGPPAGTPPPKPPVARAAVNISETGFWAAWEESEHAQGYRLDVSINSIFDPMQEGYANRDVGNRTTFQVEGLWPDTTYYYRVRAYNAAGTSAASNTSSVTTDDDKEVYTFRHYVDYFYLVLLSRMPESGAAGIWEQGYYRYYFLDGGIDVRLMPQDFGRHFVNSAEYQRRERACEEFIDDIYRVFLFRQPTADEVDVWCGQEDQWNRAEVMSIVARSPEAYYAMGILFPEAHQGGDAPSGARNFSATMYVGLLDRLPEQGALQAWGGMMEGVEDKMEGAKLMARSILASAEFQGNLPGDERAAHEQTVTHFYRAFMNRFPMTPEIEFWADELESGEWSLDEMVDYFSSSEEFADRVDQHFGD